MRGSTEGERRYNRWSRLVDVAIPIMQSETASSLLWCRVALRQKRPVWRGVAGCIDGAQCGRGWDQRRRNECRCLPASVNPFCSSSQNGSLRGSDSLAKASPTTLPFTFSFFTFVCYQHQLHFDLHRSPSPVIPLSSPSSPYSFSSAPGLLGYSTLPCHSLRQPPCPVFRVTWSPTTP